MDPLTVIGGIASVGTIVGGITKTLKNLNDARGRFERADETIHLLVIELTSIKSALIHIEDWSQYGRREKLSEELVSGFQVSIEGCTLAMEVLAKEVESLTTKNPFLRRAQYTWNEVGMKDHVARLHAQVSALQLLLSAANCRVDQQSQLLKEKRSIITRVEDDTSTLRASSKQSVGGALTIASHAESEIGETVLDVDPELIAAGPYKRALAHQKSKRRQPSPPRAAPESNNPFRSKPPSPPRIITPAPSHSDSGFYDADADMINADLYRQAMAGTHGPLKNHRSVSDGQKARQALAVQSPPASEHSSQNQMSPMERFQTMNLDDWQKPPPFGRETSSVEPVEQYGAVNRQMQHAPSLSDTAVRSHYRRPSQEQTTEMKRSFLGTIKVRASRVNLGSRRISNPPSPMEPLGSVIGSRRVKRPLDQHPHISIDFGTPEGMGAPALVRAAQSGSHIEVRQLLEQRMDVNERHLQSGKTALAVASHCGNHHVVSILVGHGANVQLADNSGMTPLHLAASRGHRDIVQLLLEEHAVTEAPGPGGKTPLRIACSHGHFEVVQLLLHWRAKVNARDNQNLTALHAAAGLGDEAVVQLLLKNRADVEARDAELMAALHYAAAGNHDTVVQTLLSYKADLEAQGRDGLTPLAQACSSGAYETAVFLISRKGNIKHKGEGNMTPLHWAAYNNHSDIIALLIKNKASVSAKNKDGKTPLHLAVVTKSFDAAELLIRKGASVEASCLKGWRPLHYACLNGDVVLIKYLLGQGAQVEAEAGEGAIAKRPLHLAAMSGSAQAVEVLLDRDARVDVFDGRAKRPLTLACSNNHLPVVHMLLDRGAAMQCRIPTSTYGEDSPLCVAVQQGHLPIVRILLARGASVRQRDDWNLEPLSYAIKHGHVAVVEELIKHGATVENGVTPVWSAETPTTVNHSAFAPEVGHGTRSKIRQILLKAAEREGGSEKILPQPPHLQSSSSVSSHLPSFYSTHQAPSHPSGIMLDPSATMAVPSNEGLGNVPSQNPIPTARFPERSQRSLHQQSAPQLPGLQELQQQRQARQKQERGEQPSDPPSPASSLGPVSQDRDKLAPSVPIFEVG